MRDFSRARGWDSKNLLCCCHSIMPQVPQWKSLHSIKPTARKASQLGLLKASKDVQFFTALCLDRQVKKQTKQPTSYRADAGVSEKAGQTKGVIPMAASDTEVLRFETSMHQILKLQIAMAQGTLHGEPAIAAGLF